MSSSRSFSKRPTLDSAPIYPRLAWQSAWRGITLLHVVLSLYPALALFPLLWLLKETGLTQVSLLDLVPLALGSLTLIACLQLGEHPDAWLRRLRRIGRPHVLRAGQPDPHAQSWPPREPSA